MIKYSFKYTCGFYIYSIFYVCCCKVVNTLTSQLEAPQVHSPVSLYPVYNDIRDILLTTYLHIYKNICIVHKQTNLYGINMYVNIRQFSNLK